jgi:hypothetical protein
MSGRTGTEERVAAQLPLVRPPDESAALERAIALAAATAAGQPVPPRRAVRRRLAAVVAGAAAVAGVALALSPAGAQVRDWIGDAVDGPPQPTRTTLGHIPGGGELLVQSRRGPWVVAADGSRRLLGDYDSATWSPRGLYVGVTKGRTLTAVEPDGDPHWSIEAPATIRDVRWSTSGQRIAYLAGSELHVIAGDGTGDFVLARGAARVAPAWMPVGEGPYSPNVLAYADQRAGAIRIAEVDDGSLRSTIRYPVAIRSLQWLDRDHLLVVGLRTLGVVDARSGSIHWLSVPRNAGVDGAAVSADGSRLAVLTQTSGGDRGPSATLNYARLDLEHPGRLEYRTLFTGPSRFGEPRFSPDGSRLLVPWRAGNQWVFLDPSRGRARPLTIGDIAHQFSPGTPRKRAPFPSVDGWCCG